MTSEADPALPLHCPNCGTQIPVRDLLRATIRETVLEVTDLLDEVADTLDDQPEQPDPQQDPLAAGLW